MITTRHALHHHLNQLGWENSGTTAWMYYRYQLKTTSPTQRNRNIWLELEEHALRISPWVNSQEPKTIPYADPHLLDYIVQATHLTIHSK